MIQTEYLKKAHKASSYNRYLIEVSEQCACFYCLRVFHADIINKSDIKSGWIDTKEAEGEGQTALCPFCGIDSVLPDAACFPLTNEFMTAMHEYWFTCH